MNRRERLYFTFVATAILALTAAAYWPGLFGDYMFDDFPNILLNQRLDLKSLSPDQLVSAALSSDSGPLRRPISMVSFALNRYAFGVAPFSFKVTNLIIHLINGILVLALSMLLLNAYRRLFNPDLSPRLIRWTGLAVSAAWLLHPLNLTAVLYIVQRMTSLAALFTLAAICTYVYGRAKASHKTQAALIWFCTPLLGVLGLLCKETAALLPLYLLVIEATLFRFRDRDGGRDRPILVYFILSVALPAVAVVTLVYIRPDLLLAGYEGRDFTVGQRLLTEARVVVDYIVWTIVPNIRTLALYHDDIPVSTGLWNPPTTLTSILVIAALIGSAFAVRRRWPLASLGILWFFAGQALESTAYPLELVFEHRNYLPDYGILLAIIGHPLLHVRSRRSAWVSGALLATFVGLLTSMTGMRSYEWRNNVTQAVYAAAHHPKSPRAMYAVGRIYANLVLTGGSNDSKRAYDALEDASRLDPASIMPDVSLIIFSARRHVSPRTTWFTRVMTRLATKPVTAADIASLKQLVQCAQKYCVTMAEPIQRILDTAVVSAKQRGANPRRTADLLTIQAQFLSNRLGDFEGARKNMEEAARLAPNRAQYHINLAKLYLVLGDRAKAASEIRTLETMNSLDQLSPMISTLKRSLRRSDNSRGSDTAQPRATSPNHGILSVKPAPGD